MTTTSFSLRILPMYELFHFGLVVKKPGLYNAFLYFLCAPFSLLRQLVLMDIISYRFHLLMVPPFLHQIQRHCGILLIDLLDILINKAMNIHLLTALCTDCHSDSKCRLKVFIPFGTSISQLTLNQPGANPHYPILPVPAILLLRVLLKRTHQI